MRAQEFILESKSTGKSIKEVTANPDTCRRGSEGYDIGKSAADNCKSRGLMPRNSGHSDGTGRQGLAGSAKFVDGKKVAGEKHKGPAKDYSKKRKDKKKRSSRKRSSRKRSSRKRSKKS